MEQRNKFEDWLRGMKGLSERSIKEYLYYYDKFGDHKNMHQDGVDKFLSKKNQSSPVKAFITNYRAFLLRHKEDLGLDGIEEKAIRDIEILRQTGSKEKKLPECLSEIEIKKIIQALSSEKNKLMGLLNFYCGLRISELVGIKYDDLNWDVWREDPTKNGKLKIKDNAKRKKWAIIEVPAFIMTRLYAWLMKEGLKKLPDGSIAPIFRIGVRRWQQLFGRASLKALGRSINPHALRHSCATWLLDNGFKIEEVQKYLRHASIATTQIYTHIRDKQVEEKYNSLFQD